MIRIGNGLIDHKLIGGRVGRWFEIDGELFRLARRDPHLSIIYFHWNETSFPWQNVFFVWHPYLCLALLWPLAWHFSRPRARRLPPKPIIPFSKCKRLRRSSASI